MFLKKRLKRATVAAVAVMAMVGGVFGYVAPAADADRVRQPDIADSVIITPRFEETANSAGIEIDLDGNASALVASDAD